MDTRIAFVIFGLLPIVVVIGLRITGWRRNRNRRHDPSNGSRRGVTRTVDTEGLSSPTEGMTISATTQTPRPLPESHDDVIVTTGEASNKRGFPCEHDGPDDYAIDVFGERFEMTPEKNRTCPKCASCMVESIRKEFARCCLCGLGIPPGVAVAAYSGGTGIRADIAARTQNGAFIGCMRRDCCPSGGFMFGHWDGTKAVSAFDGGSAAELAFHTGAIVIGEIGAKSKRKENE